jgi:DNA ligase D-like protein (predicted 3'-phosphoesterase)
MSRGSSLSEYRRKRDFKRTSEPSGGSRGKSSRGHRFVIQKHDATNLHYDLRLEVDGVLKSWAVPKGPSTDPRVKRFAASTEEHPLDYIHFEGVIPEGEYGGGTVMVWDRGTYRNLTEHRGERVPPAKAIDQGHISFWLKGKKLQGGFALTRVSKQKKGRWLLVKMDDEKADARRRPVASQPKSVLSGRTLKQIARDEAEPSGQNGQS